MKTGVYTTINDVYTSVTVAAVSCSYVPYRGKMGLGLMGKLGRAWVGAWLWCCLGDVVMCGGGGDNN